jgi:hypothetical protein
MDPRNVIVVVLLAVLVVVVLAIAAKPSLVLRGRRYRGANFSSRRMVIMRLGVAVVACLWAVVILLKVL